MSYYRVIFKDSTISHAESKSKYKGGFIMKNNRMNNSKAYNHDYYERNKNKWNKNKKGQSVNGFISSFFLWTLRAAAVTAAVAVGLSIVNAYYQWKNGGKLETDHKVTLDNEAEKKRKEAAEREEKALQSDNKLFKYKYKITNWLGKVRYFYSQAEYDKYLIGLQQKKEPCSIQEDIDAINPKFNSDRANSDENCAYCTLAYDLRRRGYNVTALNENDSGFDAPDLEEIETWYEGGKMSPFSLTSESRDSSRSYLDSGRLDKKSQDRETERLFNELASQGEGASGFFTAFFRSPYGGYTGHAMAYQVINDEAYIIDTQNGRVLNSNEFADSDYGKQIIWGTNGSEPWVYYMRTDNLQPSEGTARRVKNVDGSPTIARADNEMKLEFGESEPELVEKEEVTRKSK